MTTRQEVVTVALIGVQKPAAFSVLLAHLTGVKITSRRYDVNLSMHGSNACEGTVIRTRKMGRNAPVDTVKVVRVVIKYVECSDGAHIVVRENPNLLRRYTIHDNIEGQNPTIEFCTSKSITPEILRSLTGQLLHYIVTV